VRYLWIFFKLLLTIAVGSAALAGSLALLAPAGHSLQNATTPLGALDLTINAPAARSIVYDRFGNVIGQFSQEDRQPVKLKAVPQVLINAVLSIEDRRFYEHHGVDWGGTMRALFKNVDAGGVTQGGSTITQQLVKNTLSTNRKRDLKTKAREAILAIRLEHELSKNQILEDYLNLIYFGNRAYGVQAAAERYFDKPLKQLNLADAALIAGLIQSPEALNPITHPGAAARRRSEVLDAMVTNHKITAAQARFAKKIPLPTKTFYPNAPPLSYYMVAVRELLLYGTTAPGGPSEVLGANSQARANELATGGLKIYTAYDPYIQFAAGAAMAEQDPKRPPFNESLVVVDNSDGGVRAIANSKPFSAASQFDPVVLGSRQAGSSFKTFTLAAALSRGYSPNDTVSGDGLDYQQAGSGPDAFYKLSKDCHGGTPTLSLAIAISDNCAFVRTEVSLDPTNYGHAGAAVVNNMAYQMGIDDAAKFPPDISSTLGTHGVSPLEMAQAYMTLPNDGVAKRANMITKIVAPGGKVLYQANDPGHRVLDPQVARTEISMLEGVLHTPGATGYANLNSMTRPAAGKTGTTDNGFDAWFVGFTPQYTAAVWMGDPNGNTAMGEVFGGTYPAKIWRDVMERVTANLPPLDFAQPNPFLWPPGSFISEQGRRFTFGSAGNGGGGVVPPPQFPVAPAPTTPVTAAPQQPTPPVTKPKKHTTPTTVKQHSPPTTAGP
jgi:penicillin-binding protein 1A